MLERLERYVSGERGYTELRLHRNLSRRLAIRQGSLIENSTTSLAGCSARCHALGTFGFSSASAEDDAALERVLAEAHANADLVGRRAGHSDRPLPQTPPGIGSYDYATKKAKLGAGSRTELVKRLDDYVRRRYPDVVNTDLVLYELAIEKALVTSEGAHSYCLSPRVQLWVQLSVRGPDGPVQLYRQLWQFRRVRGPARRARCLRTCDRRALRGSAPQGGRRPLRRRHPRCRARLGRRRHPRA
jgi:TldD protein